MHAGPSLLYINISPPPMHFFLPFCSEIKKTFVIRCVLLLTPPPYDASYRPTHQKKNCCFFFIIMDYYWEIRIDIKVREEYYYSSLFFSFCFLIFVFFRIFPIFLGLLLIEPFQRSRVFCFFCVWCVYNKLSIFSTTLRPRLASRNNNN